MTHGDDDLERRLERTLRAVAGTTPNAIGTRSSRTTPRKRWPTVAAVGVVAVGVAGVLSLATRRDESPASRPEATSPTDAAPESSVYRVERPLLVSPPLDTPGLSLTPEPESFTRRLGNGWSAVLTAPSGALVFLESNPGPLVIPPETVDTRQIGEFEFATWGEAPFFVVHGFDSGCASVQIATEQTMPLTAQTTWTVELSQLAFLMHIVDGDTLDILVPEDWASYGGGLLGPRLSTEFSLPIDGAQVQFQLSQTFHSALGATVRRRDAVPTTINGEPALLVDPDSKDPSVIFEIGDDTIWLSGPVRADVLEDVAATLGHFGMDTGDLTVADTELDVPGINCEVVLTYSVVE